MELTSTTMVWHCVRSIMTVIRACMFRMTTTTVLPVGARGCDRPDCQTVDLRLYDAARKLASDFHLAPDKPLPEAIRRKKKCKTKAQQLRENEQLCFSVLNKYRRLLLDWKKRYAPQAPEAVLDERFVEACHRLPWAEYQLDILLQGDSYERGEVVSELTADGYIRKLQAHLREEQYHEQPCLD